MKENRQISDGNELREAISALDADVFYVSAFLNRDAADRLRALHSRKSHGNCILILTTFGGDSDAAYIMARFLREGHPNGFSAFIAGNARVQGLFWRWVPKRS